MKNPDVSIESATSTQAIYKHQYGKRKVLFGGRQFPSSGGSVGIADLMLSLDPAHDSLCFRVVNIAVMIMIGGITIRLLQTLFRSSVTAMVIGPKLKIPDDDFSYVIKYEMKLLIHSQITRQHYWNPGMDK